VLLSSSPASDWQKITVATATATTKAYCLSGTGAWLVLDSSFGDVAGGDNVEIVELM